MEEDRRSLRVSLFITYLEAMQSQEHNGVRRLQIDNPLPFTKEDMIYLTIKFENLGYFIIIDTYSLIIISPVRSSKEAHNMNIELKKAKEPEAT